MPKALERRLRRKATSDPAIKDKDAYVYGTLHKVEKKTKRRKTSKRREHVLT